MNSAQTERVRVIVNGQTHDRSVEPRLHLGDFLRQELGLTGTHIGCEHGVCGSCTVILDGAPVRSCLMFAGQADGCSVTTVEALAPSDGSLHPIQQAFWQRHALQCGFCTPGMIMTLLAFLKAEPDADEHAIRDAVSGNICRCTGYQAIVEAALEAAKTMRERGDGR
jgi:aerobic-type carbon monoxide dehydrogenase small subunit (CoxS/CutS family)